MLFKKCAGGIVFSDNKVLILKNQKREWVLPCRKIRSGELAVDTALSIIESINDSKINLVSTAGETNYEFFSISKQKQVCNKVVWYTIEVNSYKINIAESKKYIDGGYYNINKALKLLTYNEHKSLINVLHKKYLDIVKNRDLVIA